MLVALLNDDSAYQIAADVAESLFAMLIAVVETAVVDVDLEMLPKHRCLWEEKKGVGTKRISLLNNKI